MTTKMKKLKALRFHFLVNRVRGVSVPPGPTDDEDQEDLEIIETDSVFTQRRNSGALNPASELLQHISKYLPPRLVQCTWTLAYSALRHGTSLRTLYKGTLGLDCCTLTVIKDTCGQVFGAFCSAPLKVSLSYYGTGQTFLFSFSPHLKVYRWTRGNSYFVKGSMESLVFGGGRGHFGLWVDEDLHHGRSQRCETFDNDILSTDEDFLINDLEVWALS
ncbi:TLD domain-containing protein 2-like isoform X2 [Megalops cyprinoides]|uniref:TLD domain-containing protein 2-like isoform X2 n=1 Tax=Megalops cyprinoides TaxID=118141 RepID=UPI001864D323|nr:TLD domain-containing protein 2-like isoform X2 [Megalops cyprinoides]